MTLGKSTSLLGRYEKWYDLQLKSPVTVAVQKAPLTKLVSIRTFTKQNAEKALYTYQHIQHKDFVAALEVFLADEYLYVVLEHMPISLEHVVKTPRYPTALELAAIVGQVSTY